MFHDISMEFRGVEWCDRVTVVFWGFQGRSRVSEVFQVHSSGFQGFSMDSSGRSRGVPVDFRSIAGGFGRFKGIPEGFRALHGCFGGFKAFEECSRGSQGVSEG